MTFEYDGTNFSGLQVQEGKRTIQGEIEKVFLKLFSVPTELVASGRTDTGVHALGQVVNFHTNTTIKPEKLAIVINLHLPKDVRVVKSFEVAEEFNSRFDAKKKTYIYKICTDEHLSVFKQGLCLHYPKKLDINKMNEVARKLVGEHDFSSFMATGSAVKTTVRTIYNAEFFEQNGDLVFTITGNGFLYNMVRIIVGTLLEIGCGKRQDNMDILLQGNNRKLAGKTISANGLYLKEVIYK